LVEKLGRLEEDEATLYIAEMIVAIHSLHNLGYIHRDLKPDNFLIDAAGHVKLADFGLSKEGLSHFTEDSPGFRNINKTTKLDPKPGPGFYSVVGSPHYMAPEIIKLAPDGYGKEVDWWSLGCLIFEMVTGNPPFEGTTPQEVFDNITSWQIKLPKILSDFRQHLSEEFILLISGFLCEPEKRFGNDLNTLKKHAFFKTVDWDNLRNMRPLFVPQLDHKFDVSYFENNLHSPSSTVNQFSRYYKKCLKKTEQACNILQVQLQRLHRSRSFDISELHAHNVPPWVTPYKRIARRSIDPALVTETSKDNIMLTPMKDSPITPCSDKQILGFTFQRKQSSRVTDIDVNKLPSFKLVQEIEEEQNEEMIDV